MITIGSNEMTKAYLGSTEVKKICLGSEQVWPVSTPSRLPVGYNEIEYISSNGSQFIDLGFAQGSRNFIFEMKFRWTGTNDGLFETFIGYMKASGVTPRFGFHKHQGEWMYGTNATNTSSIAVDHDIHTVRIEGKASNNKESFYLDDVLISTTSTASTGLSGNTISMYLLARNRVSSKDNPSSVDVYSVKYTVYDSSTYTNITSDYDFVPCTDSNEDYGVYDIVNDTFCIMQTI